MPKENIRTATNTIVVGWSKKGDVQIGINTGKKKFHFVSGIEGIDPEYVNQDYNALWGDLNEDDLSHLIDVLQKVRGRVYPYPYNY